MKRQIVLVWLPLLALAAFVAVGFGGFSYDDNFITYRYAQHWQQGDGLVFNLGERVFGTSAPGYAVLLGALGIVGAPFGIEIPLLGTWISLAAILLTAAVLHLFLLGPGGASTRAAGAAATLAFGALALSSQLDVYLLGTETLPTMALVVLAAYLLLGGGTDSTVASTRRDIAAGVVIGLAMCLRLDAALAAGILGVVAWVRRRRLPAAYAAFGLALLVLFLLGLYLYYGTVVPNTLSGKRALRELSYTLRQWQTLKQTLPLPSAVVLLVGASGGCLVLLRRNRWRRALVLALAIWVVGHEVAYRVLDVWFAPWYHLALWHALLVLYALCASAIAASAADRFLPKARALVTVALSLLLATPILLPSLRWTIDQWGQPPDYRYDIYRRTAEALQRPPNGFEGCAASPETSALAFEIGIVGYYSDCRILDLGGLVSPDFTQAKFTFRRPALAASLEPDFIVAIEDPLIDAILEQPGVRDRYRLVVRLTDPKFRSQVRLLGKVDPRAPRAIDEASGRP